MTKEVILKINNQSGEHAGYIFFCPGCKCAHMIDFRWEFNNDFVKPTFSPSYLVNKASGVNRCHSFIRNGNIEFCTDCDHELAGKTVPLEEF